MKKRVLAINEPTRRLLEVAKVHGWAAVATRGGHIKLCKAGCEPQFVSSTPSDHRAYKNALARLRRAMRPPRSPA